MPLHPLYESEDNRLLLALEARELVRAGAVAALAWGLICAGLAAAGLADGTGTVRPLVLGLLMAVAGLGGAFLPRLWILGLPLAFNLILLGNNVVAAVDAVRSGAEVAPTGLVLPAIAAVAFLALQLRLRRLVLPAAATAGERVAALRSRFREALAADGDGVVEFADDIHRLVADGDELLLVSPSHRRDLVADAAGIGALLEDPQARKPLLRLPHPLGEVLLAVNKTNAKKLMKLLAPAA